MTTETVGGRIRSRRRELKLTQSDIAKYIGISASAVTQWEQGLTIPNGQSLIFLSEILACAPDWLMTGKESDSGVSESRHLSSASGVKEIPVISWVQAGQWTDPCIDGSLDIYSLKTASETVLATAKVSEQAFALKVKGDSMTSGGGLLSIPEGSTVVVDPVFDGIDSVIGKIVVVQLGGTGEATIKKLVLDGSIYYLMPLNPSFRAIEISQDCRLIGVVKQVIINF